LDVRIGVYVTIIGMALVFASLTIIMLVIMALSRIFRPHKVPSDPFATTQSQAASSETEELAKVAAIAVAMALSKQAEEDLSLPPPVVPLLSIRSHSPAWKASGRLHGVR